MVPQTTHVRLKLSDADFGAPDLLPPPHKCCGHRRAAIHMAEILPLLEQIFIMVYENRLLSGIIT